MICVGQKQPDVASEISWTLNSAANGDLRVADSHPWSLEFPSTSLCYVQMGSLVRCLYSQLYIYKDVYICLHIHIHIVA